MDQAAFFERAQYSHEVRPTQAIKEKDFRLLQERIKAREAMEDRPTVGDWVRLPHGELRRISHDWDDAYQLTTGEKAGSFHMFNDGVCSFSGSLHPKVKASHFASTQERINGSCWFFSNDWVGAHRGVYVEAPFRVWELTCTSADLCYAYQPGYKADY